MRHASLLDALIAKAGRLHAKGVLRRFLAATENATAVQQRVLFEKIARNHASDFGRDHGFAAINSYDDFVRNVPVAGYERFEPYIERVKAGETNAMFGDGQRVHMFALTSGTTDRPKYIPVTDAFLKEYRRGWNAFGVKALLDHPGAFLKPIVQITSTMDEEHTDAGIPCGAITGLIAGTQKRIVRRYYVTLPCTGYIKDATARYYTIMRLALAGDVGFMVTANPATQLRLARTADAHAPALIRDIRDGTLSAQMDIDTKIRATLAPRLIADVARARQLDAAARKRGRLLPRDVWNLGFLANWTGGTLGLNLRDFPEYFGDTPVRDIGLMASEGRMTLPLEDHTTAGVLEVTSNFFEFIPADQRDSAHPDVLRSHEVRAGQEYFILLTTSSGLYRYDIGDQVRVVGWQGQAPIIEFLNKGSSVSSLAGEKLTEQQVVTAFGQAAAALGAKPGLFVFAATWDNEPGYVLHVEHDGIRNRLEHEWATAMEEQLRRLNIEYACKRDSQRLGPIRVNLLPPGCLAGREQAITAQRTGRHEQYKHRYLLTQPGDDRDLPKQRPPTSGAPANKSPRNQPAVID